MRLVANTLENQRKYFPVSMWTVTEADQDYLQKQYKELKSRWWSAVKDRDFKTFAMDAIAQATESQLDYCKHNPWLDIDAPPTHAYSEEYLIDVYGDAWRDWIMEVE